MSGAYEKDGWTAEFVASESASPVPANVAIVDDQIFIRLRNRGPQPRAAEVWPASEVSLAQVYEGVWQLQRPGQVACIHIREAGLLRELEAVGVARPGGGPGTGLGRRAAALAVGCGLVFSLSFWLGSAPLAGVLARGVPIEAEAGLASLVEAIWGDSWVEDESAARALQQMHARMKLDDDRPLPIKFHLMDYPLENAFAFPGGAIAITCPLVDSASGIDEIAGVLGHELEHIQQRHVMKALIHGAMLAVVWNFATGGDGLHVIGEQQIRDLVDLGFSRGDEREADMGALARLDAAGIDHLPLAAFFDRHTTEGEHRSDLWSTHPANAERIDYIRSFQRSEAAVGTQFDEGVLSALRDACSAAKARPTGR